MTIIEAPRLGPTQKRGKSKQDVGTPWEFIRAVERRFGPIVHDLAASADNTKALTYYSLATNSLAQPWAKNLPTGNLWLNPEFATITPWVAKCAEESPKRHGLILVLTPASIGTEWFANHVHRQSMVLGLSPRMTFIGSEDPYPKDLMLSVYGYGLNGFDVWRWDQ